MPKHVDEAKANAIREWIGDPEFLQAMTTGALPLQPNSDFAELLRRLDIAELQYNRRDHQPKGPLKPPSI